MLPKDHLPPKSKGSIWKSVAGGSSEDRLLATCPQTHLRYTPSKLWSPHTSFAPIEEEGFLQVHPHTLRLQWRVNCLVVLSGAWRPSNCYGISNLFIKNTHWLMWPLNTVASPARGGGGGGLRSLS
uniref:Uncharacterized protein n=1 Tax=Eutreptiella gymnastica TaxID=73025 RepID=A0A7S1NWD1_9EUGL|mmetsp:Transcript_99589/g.171485  ORF Transcript_99589/g.171485 Transcript_99589/m.171485 type:complete len:126 (+) Transcript_99589:101-478(+)